MNPTDSVHADAETTELRVVASVRRSTPCPGKFAAIGELTSYRTGYGDG